jgi:ABC-type transporter Mla MlaB component
VQAVAVPARIDADNALQVLDGLREATRGAADGPVALDLAELREFDSTALSLLLQLARERNGAGGGPRAAAPTKASASGRSDAEASPLFLLNPPEKLQELAELYGVHEMLFGIRRGGIGEDARGAQVGQGGDVGQGGQVTGEGIRSRP